MRKVEAKWYPDLDQSKDRESSNDLDQSKDPYSDRESSSSHYFVYVQKPKTNKFKCEACNQELTQKNYNRQNQSLKHKKMSYYIVETKLLRVLMRMELKLLMKI